MNTRIASLVFGLSVVLGFAGITGAADRPLPVPRLPIPGGDAKHSKLSSELRELVRVQRSHGPATLSDATVQIVIQTNPNDIEVTKSSVQAVGGTFEMATSDLVLARVPVSALEMLASAKAVNVVRRPRAPTTFQTISEGLNFIGTASWHSAGRKGAGVKIAILDVGFSGYQSLMGSELPQIPAARIRSFSGDISGNGEEHGTGVAEVVYDIAPQAELYLVNFSNEVELESAVQWLIDQHVDVINASWGFPCGGPLDGTGRTNAVVKKAADAGILWVSAAGNFARRHWSSIFNDTDGDKWHNFSSNEAGNTVFMNSGDDLRVCVEWDDWANKDQDLELFVWDSEGAVVESSTENQSGPSTHDPWERLDFTANVTGNYYIGVKRFSGTRNPRLHLYAYPPGEECAIESAVHSESEPRGLLSELREFRDVVLASSPAGRGWIESYYRHSREVRRILLLHPGLAIDAAGLLSASRPAVRSVLAARSGQTTSTFVFSQDYATRVDRFLEQLAGLGSTGLRHDLEEFRATAAFSAAAGQSADRYWDRLLNEGHLDSGAAAKTFPDAGYMLHITGDSSIVPPADSPNAFTVGAIDWSTGGLEEFSSRGPTADGRRKPDIAGPDGVCTTTYGECGGNGFRGTSAAAPHVAGAVALVRHAYPSLSLSGVRDFLTGRAVDVAPVGPDNQTGAGRLAMGSLSNVDVLPAPILSYPTGNATPIWPTYYWSEVNRATTYRVMVATSLSALPTDSSSQTCTGGCIVNTTTSNTHFTPPGPLIPTTTYYWQVQGLAPAKNGLWAQTSFKTTVPPELTLPERLELDEYPGSWITPAGKAILIAHGWNSDANSWVQKMAQTMCRQFGASATTSRVEEDALTKLCQANGWDIWVLDWSGKAGLFGGPSGAFTNATAIGEKLASNLKLKNYTHVHFIAHSAGSNLIHHATTGLADWLSNENRPGLDIHETFLDAYDPSFDASRYGSKASWADHYVDTRSVDLNTGKDGTKLLLQHAYNVDVTPTTSEDCGPICRHSRPYRFYGESVDTSFDVDAGGDDPISSTGGMGYPLTTENGRSLSSLSGTYPNGGKCIMRGDTCTSDDIAISQSTFTPARAPSTVNATAGVVHYVTGSVLLFESLKLGFMSQSLSATAAATPSSPAAAPTEAPSWIVVDAITAAPVNRLRFKWRFGSAGEGLLRVFVDGMPVREIDQRHVPVTATKAEEVYIGGAVGTLAPGTHRIVFRLDGFATGASGVELTGVELGLVTPGTRRRAARH